MLFLVKLQAFSITYCRCDTEALKYLHIWRLAVFEVLEDESKYF